MAHKLSSSLCFLQLFFDLAFSMEEKKYVCFLLIIWHLEMKLKTCIISTKKKMQQNESGYELPKTFTSAKKCHFASFSFYLTAKWVANEPLSLLTDFCRERIREFTNKIIERWELWKKSSNESCSEWVIIIIKFRSPHFSMLRIEAN